MYHIRKNRKGEFYVVLTGKNYEPLSTTESFTRKQSAWKNIRAQMALVGTHSVLALVKDECKTPNEGWMVSLKGKIRAVSFAGTDKKKTQIVGFLNKPYNRKK